MATALSPVYRKVRDSILRVGTSDEQKWLREAADMGNERLESYGIYEDYYNGEHRVQLTDREKEYLQACGFPYAENFCETIVNTHAARMILTGFESENTELGSFARSLWEQNEMDAEQIKLHEGIVKLGDYFVIVEPQEGGLPALHLNHPGKVKAVYDSGEMVYAVKVWNTSRYSASNPQGRTIRRMNLYWPDAIQKWFAPDEDGDTWAAFKQKDDDELTQPWTMDGTPDGEPIGIPVIHFANRPNPHYGRSHLRGVVPRQDALNKSCIDYFWVMDAQGWPQQWGTGIKADDLERHPGSLWTSEKAESRFGQMDPADPERSIKGIESQVARMASGSDTPLHLMLAGGNLPSGETLKTSESGLSRTTRGRQVTNGGDYSQVVKVSARVEKAFGQTDPPTEEAKIKARWERAESRQELDEANTAVLWTGLGVSRDTTLSRLGFDPEEERKKREAEGTVGTADELLEKARQMQRGETTPAGTGGEQPREGKTTKASGRTR